MFRHRVANSRVPSIAAAGAAILMLAAPAMAQTRCQNTGSFGPWLETFRRDAAAAGVTPGTIQRALGGMTLDPGIIARDRRQGFFAQSFLDFSAKLATVGRVQSGRRKLTQHAAIFADVEKGTGVPPAVITAFWALESDFGSGMGNLPVLRSLASLAYDCRRGDLFRGELLAALQIIDRGDLVPSEMIGSWAGELGQTQFLPSHYLKHAVDYDGDGRRNLMASPGDIIASTAAFIVSLDWKAGQPWLREVRVPAQLAWDQADLAIQKPQSEWARLGVTAVDGKSLPADNLPASLLLMMGRNGPAFLAYPNFQIFIKWNQSLNYATTAAYLATRLAGAPAMSRGRAKIEALKAEQVKELQTLLIRRGFLEGEADGKVGAGTRLAVKKAQLKHGLPADSFPTPELLGRLKGR